jgi:alcohol dehydrogenase (cytochrome c)
MTTWKRFAPALACLVLMTSLVALGQVAPNVTPDRLVNAATEPQNWLTYSGSYFSQRFSQLTQITPANAGSLEVKWIYQGAVVGPWQATPLVVDGVMYVSQRPNDVVALDGSSGVLRIEQSRRRDSR